MKENAINSVAKRIMCTAALELSQQKEMPLMLPGRVWRTQLPKPQLTARAASGTATASCSTPNLEIPTPAAAQGAQHSSASSTWHSLSTPSERWTCLDSPPSFLSLKVASSSVCPLPHSPIEEGFIAVYFLIYAYIYEYIYNYVWFIAVYIYIYKYI